MTGQSIGTFFIAWCIIAGLLVGVTVAVVLCRNLKLDREDRERMGRWKP